MDISPNYFSPWVTHYILDQFKGSVDLVLEVGFTGLDAGARLSKHYRAATEKFNNGMGPFGASLPLGARIFLYPGLFS